MMDRNRILFGNASRYMQLLGISLSCLVSHCSLLCVIWRERTQTDWHSLFYCSATIRSTVAQMVSGYTIVSPVKGRRRADNTLQAR